jgi:hypothetical protein
MRSFNAWRRNSPISTLLRDLRGRSSEIKHLWSHKADLLSGAFSLSPQSLSHIVSMAFTNATVFLYLARSLGRKSESGPKSCTKAL